MGDEGETRRGGAKEGLNTTVCLDGARGEQPAGSTYGGLSGTRLCPPTPADNYQPTNSSPPLADGRYRQQLIG